MIHTDERLLEQAAAWREAGRKVAVATVVSTWGSSPRPAGSMLIVDEAGEMQGSVSGGCIEGAVIREAMACMAGRAAQAARVRRLERAGLGRRASPAVAGCRSMSRRWSERRRCSRRSNEARAAKRRVCLVRYLDDGARGAGRRRPDRARRGAAPTSPRPWRRRLRRDQSMTATPAVAAPSCRCSTRPCG